MSIFLRPSKCISLLPSPAGACEAAQDIDKLLAQIAANRRKIKMHTRTKNRLVEDLQANLRQSAYNSEILTAGQIAQYGGFFRHYDSQTTQLATCNDTLKDKMARHKLPQEILKQHTDLATVVACLGDIACTQDNIIQILENIIAAGREVSAAIDSISS